MVLWRYMLSDTMKEHAVLRFDLQVPFLWQSIDLNSNVLFDYAWLGFWTTKQYSLSQYTCGFDRGGTWSSASNDCSHITSIKTRARLLYSASVVKRATTGCFLALQETRLSPMNIQNPDVDLWSSTSFAMSASQKTMRINLEEGVNLRA